MNESDYQELLVTAALRPLTAAERTQLEAWFAAHPEARTDWELDQRLTRCLRRLPNRPVPSNFTTQVLHRLDRLESPGARSRGRSWLRRLGGVRLGWQVGGAVCLFALVLVLQQRQAHQRAELARSLETLPAVTLAEVDLWRDFESINSLPAGPLPSVDQLAEALR